MNKYKRRSTKTLLQLFGAKFFLIVVTSVLLIGVSSCDKSSSVGLNVQPVNDLLNIGFQDTTTLYTRTVKEDSLRTDQNLIVSEQALLGKYIDPVFGEADASIYTQLRMNTAIFPTVPYAFGNHPICDSVVLALAYGYNEYGESPGKHPLRRQTVNVYEVTDNFTGTIPVYSNSGLGYNSSNDLANAHTFVPDLDSVSVKEYVLGSMNVVVKAPQLRIRLQQLFGQTILNNQTTYNLAGTVAFQNLLKGFYITANSTSGLGTGEGRLLTYDLSSSNSVLRVYYHNDTTVVSAGGHGEIIPYDFLLSGNDRFATFHTPHTIGSFTNDSLISQLDTVNNKRKQFATTYIQSLGGAKTKIKLPYIYNWVSGGPIAVNKAELIVKVDPSTLTYRQDSYAPPTALLLFGINDDGTSYLLPDLTEAPYYYNGSYDATNHQYVLNISRYIQQLLDKKVNNNGLYLVVPHISAATKANRVIIGGGAAKNADGTPNAYQMKLNITYTKLH